ncbi:hypothetical protein D3C75_623670 [compost metagenome]
MIGLIIRKQLRNLGALVVVGCDGNILDGIACCVDLGQVHKIPEGKLVAHPRRPAGTVIQQGLDFGVRTCAAVDGGLYEKLVIRRCFRYREVRQRRSSMEQRHFGYGSGEACIVIRCNLIAYIIIDGIRIFVSGIRSADQSAVQHMPVGCGDRLAVRPGAVGGAVVGALGRVQAEAHHIAGIARVVAQHIINLALCKAAVFLGLSGVGALQPIRIHEGQEGGISGVAEGAPGIQPGQAAGCVFDFFTGIRSAGGPVVQIPLGGYRESGIPRQTGQQHLGPIMLVIPGMGPLIAPIRGLAFLAPFICRVNGFIQISLLIGCQVQPNGRPGQLILVPAPGVVEGLGILDAVRILTPVGICEGKELAGMGQKRVGISGVAVPEYNGRGSHCCRRFTGQIGARKLGSDLIRGSVHLHHLGGTPPVMIGIACANLAVQFIGGRMGLDEIVIDEPEIQQDLIQLSGLHISILILVDTPSQHGSRSGHRQTEFHMISRIIPAAGQILAHIGAVCKTRIASPGDAVPLGQHSRLLGFIEKQRFLQHLAIIERCCRCSSRCR